MQGIKNRRRLLSVAIGIATVAIAAFVVMGGPGAGAAPGNGKGSASAAAHGGGQPSGDTTAPQPPSNADFSGNGANVHGPYDSTRDGSASQNGKGGGAAVGKPCAGCVGKADNKNPAGQMPGGSDGNAGYECDRNQGIGQSNPAHTSCTSGATPPPSTTPNGPPSSTPNGPPSSTPNGPPSSTPNGPPSSQTPPAPSTEVPSPASSSPVAVPPASTPPASMPPNALASTGTPELLAQIALALLLMASGALFLVSARGRKARHSA